MEITEKEFAVIREISTHQKQTQRLIARRIGISLGLTNLIINRLAKKGYIKIQEAPPRTIVYMLTPKGLAEKIRKSYQFTLRTIKLLKIVKISIQKIILEEYKQGARKIIINGRGELATLTELALHDLNLKDVSYSRKDKELRKNIPQCNILIARNGIEKKVNILSELTKGNFAQRDSAKKEGWF